MHKLLVIFFCATVLVHFSVELDPNNTLENPQAIEVTKKAILDYKNSNITKNDECAEQLGLFLENLEQSCGDNWTIQVIDATVKMPPEMNTEQHVGFLYGKCSRIKSDDAAVKGLFSINTLEHPYYKSTWNQLIRDNKNDSRYYIFPNLGICIPDKCDEEDVASVLDSTPTTANGENDQKVPIDLGALITIGYFGVFIMLMFTSTIYDILTKNGKPHPLLLSFSIRTNVKKLFSTKKNPHHFECLYGLKVICMIWMLAGHQVMTKLIFNPFSNGLETDQYDHTFESIVVIIALNSADTFLVITGCLIAYNYMKMKHMGNWFNIIFYYVRKYIRLTFAIIPMLLSTIFLTKYLSYGPLEPVIDPLLVEPCREYWWSTLLLIGDPNNDDICLLQTWYLNVDLQLYQLAPVFLYLVSKFPNFGIGAMIGAILSSMVISFMNIWNSDIETDGFADIHLYLYYFTSFETRAATWFLGCLLGYALAEIKLQNQYISTIADERANKLNWIMVFTEIPVWIFLGVYRLLSYEHDRLNLAVYNAVASTGWGICVTWIIFACSTGVGGIVNKFLSMSIFQILSRFVFSVFIVHLNIMFIFALNPPDTIYFPAFNCVSSFLVSTLMTLIISLFWVLAFESPISRIEDYLLKDKFINSKNRTDENNNIVLHLPDSIKARSTCSVIVME